MKITDRLLAIPAAAAFVLVFSSCMFLVGSIGMFIGYAKGGLFGLQTVAANLAEHTAIVFHGIYLMAQGKFSEAITYLDENMLD